ncbi:MAG: methyl-accepting chemotaxis protein [Hahellaceae bacterium]|nr:methyl-accepting chemotaxis protein [Hahellaceae bacterium]
MLNKITLRTQLYSLLVGMVVLLTFFTVTALNVVSSMSKDAVAMGLGKDVVADILPPPLYVIEAELVAEELRQAPRADVEDYLARLQTLKNDYDQRNAYWETTEMDEKVKQALLGEQKQAADVFWSVVMGSYTDAIKKRDQGAIESEFGKVRSAYLRHRQGVDKTVALASAFASSTLTELEMNGARSGNLLLAVAIIGTAIIGLSMVWVIHSILRKLGGEPSVIQQVAQRIAQGDLSHGDSRSNAPAGSLMVSMQHMQGNLRSIIQEARRVALAVEAAAEDLDRNSTAVTSSSSRQTDAANSMAAAIEEVTVTVSHIADNARSAQEKAGANQKLTAEGSRLIQGTITEIGDVAETVAKSSSAIKALGDKSSQISSIVEVIKAIAEQTNLLALNAAIEAARAGEQGRGFAVVADEVRGLAARTAQSTQEISMMIAGIQQSTQQAVQAMEKGSSQVTAGVSMAASTGRAVEEINDGMRGLLLSVGEISNSLSEQSSASQDLAKHVEMIAQMSDTNFSAIKAVSDLTGSLSALSQDLNRAVGRFKL